jgi:hypothetical protein
VVAVRQQVLQMQMVSIIIIDYKNSHLLSPIIDVVRFTSAMTVGWSGQKNHEHENREHGNSEHESRKHKYVIRLFPGNFNRYMRKACKEPGYDAKNAAGPVAKRSKNRQNACWPDFLSTSTIRTRGTAINICN